MFKCINFCNFFSGEPYDFSVKTNDPYNYDNNFEVDRSYRGEYSTGDDNKPFELLRKTHRYVFVLRFGLLNNFSRCNKRT